MTTLVSATRGVFVPGKVYNIKNFHISVDQKGNLSIWDGHPVLSFQIDGNMMITGTAFGYGKWKGVSLFLFLGLLDQLFEHEVANDLIKTLSPHRKNFLRWIFSGKSACTLSVSGKNRADFFIQGDSVIENDGEKQYVWENLSDLFFLGVFNRLYSGSNANLTDVISILHKEWFPQQKWIFPCIRKIVPQPEKPISPSENPEKPISPPEKPVSSPEKPNEAEAVFAAKILDESSLIILEFREKPGFEPLRKKYARGVAIRLQKVLTEKGFVVTIQPSDDATVNLVISFPLD